MPQSPNKIPPFLSIAPVSVVVCGLVRNQNTALKSLEHFTKWREEGLVNQIIYSTWKGELNKYPEFRAALLKNDVSVVESDEPSIILSGHALHQFLSLKAGLDSAPEGSLILKARWDKLLFSNNLTAVLRARWRLALPSSSNFSSPFKAKIHVQAGYLRHPFLLSDLSFVALKEDLLVLVNAAIRISDPKFPIGPEPRLFGSLWAESLQIVNDYFLVDPVITSWGNPNRPKMLANNLENDFYCQTLMLYFLVISSFFSVGSTSPTDENIEEMYSSLKQLTWREWFEITPVNPKFPLEFHDGAYDMIYYSDLWLEPFLQGILRLDDLGERLLMNIQKAKELVKVKNVVTSTPSSQATQYREQSLATLKASS